MLPTARAQALAVPIAEALAIVRATLTAPGELDPRALRRTFTVATDDYVELVLLPRLLARLTRVAPEVTLNVRPTSDRTERELLSGAHDLAIGPPPDGVSELRSTRLFSDRFVSVLRARHPDAKKRLTLARFTRLAHVLVSPQGAGEAPVDVALRAVGRTRRVALRVPHFLVAPLAVAASDYVATLPARVVRAVAELGRLAAHAPPVEVPTFSISMIWHERNDHEPAHQWFRELVAEVAREE
jgi:DNA-binding transcriptional LysR family regulator